MAFRCTRAFTLSACLFLSVFVVSGSLTASFAAATAKTAASKDPGAPVAGPVAMLEAVTQSPIWRDDPFIITLRPDETACRRVFGDEWQERCQVWPGEAEAVVKGISTTPAVAGRWRWTSGASMHVVPDGGWPAETSYSVDLSRVPLPLGAKLGNKIVNMTTPPLAAHVEDGRVWINPDPAGTHSVSFALRFTTPPDRATVEKAFSLTPNNKALKLASPVFVWTDGGTRCHVTANILELTDNPASVKLDVLGVGRIVKNKGRWSLQPGRVNGFLEVPGASTLFRPQVMKLEAVLNESLQTEYHVVLRFSMRVAANEVQRHLNVLELPETRDAENLAPLDWSRAQIAPGDLEGARALKTEHVTLPGESSDIVRFKVPATPGRHVALVLRKGFGPSKKLTLDRDHVVSGLAQAPKAGVHFLQPGNVLPLSGERRVDFVSTDLTRVEWRARRVLPDRLGVSVLASELGSRSSWGDEDLLSVSDTVSGTLSMPTRASNQGVPQPVFNSLDLSPLFLNRPDYPNGPVTGLIYLKLTGYKGDTESNTVSRLVLVTDLGLVLKEDSQGGLRAFVCSLGQGGPVAGAKVAVIGENGLPVAEAVTNAQGVANLPSVKGLAREKRPRAVVATLARGGITDLSWMPLSNHERRVDYSRFAVQGQRSESEGLNAYVFSQRGIFRPGETLHFGFMLRRSDWKTLPKDMPLQTILRDAAGRVILRRAITAGDGFGELSFTVSESAPTGRYQLAVALPSTSEGEELVLGSGSVLVEEFQPETLSVAAEIEASGTAVPGKGWIRPGTDAAQVAARVTLRNLYGLPAANRRVQGSLYLSPASLAFPGFESYTFADMLPWRGESLNRPLPETQSGADGRALLPLGLDAVGEGTLEAFLAVEGFEPNGGRAVSTDKRFLVSPLPYMLGYRPAGAAGNLGFIPKGSGSGLEFVAVDPELALTDPGPLVFEVAERHHVTSLVSDSSGKFRYDETPVDTPLSSASLQMKKGTPFFWPLPTDRAGEFLLTVRADGRVLARVPFSVAGDEDVRPALTSPGGLPSTQLRVRLDKTDYAPGDTVQVAVSAPFDGVGLLTLERDSVAAHVWFKAKAGHSVQTLTIPADFEGKGYVNVSLARALTSPDIFLQPHAYAVVPLTVNVKQRDLGLRLAVPAHALPGQELAIRVTADRPGRALVFAVDEGVLQLTRFITPDPLRYLLLDRALEVGTLQFFDLLMPDHSLLAKRAPAFGGGMNMAEGRFQNPFKRRGEPPLAWWSGIVDLGPEEREFKVPVPDYYNGQVRIMTVGLSANMVGRAEASSIVRGSLVLTPQLPVMAAPEDRFEAALALANGGGEPLRLRLETEADPALQILAQPPASVDLAPGEERVVVMELRALAEPGNAALRFTATDQNGRTTRRSATLSIRPPTLPAHAAASGRASTSQRLTGDRELLAFEATGSATVSATPLAPVRGILRYLRSYPYACVEQSLSRAFPLLLLYRNPSLDAALYTADPATAEKERRTALDRALAALRGAFDSQSGVRSWVYGYDEGNLLLTTYAADWLLALREAGLGLPGDLMPVFNTLEGLADKTPNSLVDARVQAYAIWVLTRAGFITTQKLEQLAESFDSATLPADPLFTLMAGSYAALRMDAAAAKALNRASGMPSGPVQEPMNATALQALHVAVLARHFPDRLADEADKLTQNLLAGLNGPGGYATFAAAQSARALLALAAGSGKIPGNPLAGVELVCTAAQPGFDLPQAQPRNLGSLLALDAPGCATYDLRLPPNSRPLYWEVETGGYDRRPPVKAEQQGVSLERTLRLADGTLLSSATGKLEVPQGAVLRVEVRASLHGGPEAEVVLADLLPGGFEMILNHDGNSVASPPDRLERREDRFIAHTTLGTETKTCIYHIRAVNKGQFTLPATRAEGLYDRALRASTASGQIWVK